MSRAPMPDTVKGDAPMPSSFDDDLEFWDEGRWSKLLRRLKEEPLIPIGLAATCYALYGATKSIRKGDKTQTNRFFRARVYAQAFTLLCLCVGSVYWKEDREKRKHYEGLLGEKRAQEKREAWIKELEARDEEDMLEREKKKKRREMRVQMEKRREIEELEAGGKKGGEVQGAGGKKSVDVQSSMVEGDEMRRLAAGGSPLLAAAMGLWRRRYPRSSKEDDDGGY